MLFIQGCWNFQQFYHFFILGNYCCLCYLHHSNQLQHFYLHLCANLVFAFINNDQFLTLGSVLTTPLILGQTPVPLCSLHWQKPIKWSTSFEITVIDSLFSQITMIISCNFWLIYIIILLWQHWIFKNPPTSCNQIRTSYNPAKMKLPCSCSLLTNITVKTDTLQLTTIDSKVTNIWSTMGMAVAASLLLSSMQCFFKKLSHALASWRKVSGVYFSFDNWGK